MIIIPSSIDISLEVNGNRIGVAQSYNAKIAKDKHSHSVTLGRVCFTGQIDMNDLPIFNIIITKPDRKIIYSGCEWACFDEKNQSGYVMESLTAIAAKRLEIA